MTAYPWAGDGLPYVVRDLHTGEVLATADTCRGAHDARRTLMGEADRDVSDAYVNYEPDRRA
jgi:hypothetical protein